MATFALLALAIAPFLQVHGTSIREGPRNVTILQGGTVELRCVFSNRGTTQVMWFRSGGEMISNGNSIVANARPSQGSYDIAGNKRRGEYFLVITNVQLEDADEYSCAYTKEVGDMDSSSAFLIVQAPPSAGYPVCSIEPESPRLGDYATFTCRSEGGVPNANLMWYRNSMPRTSVTLKISRFRKVLKLEDMNSQFFCQADSPVEDSPRRCEVRPVQILASVVMNPSELYGTLNEELYVSCIRVDKTSHTNFMWFYNDDPVENLADSRRFQILGSGDTMKITRLMRRDNGATIKCQLQIYKAFMKHASGTILIQDLSYPIHSTTSFSISPSQKTENGDVVTSFSPSTSNVTYDPVTLSQGSDYDGRTQNIFIVVILILSPILLMVILLLCLIFFKSFQKRKVSGNDANIQGRGGQRTNLRHVYETSFPVGPIENEAMLSERDSNFGGATYQDHDSGMINNQGAPQNGEMNGCTILKRYESAPGLPNNSRDKMYRRNCTSDGVYEMPLTDQQTTTPTSSTSSPSTDGYVDIMREDGRYRERDLKTKQEKKLKAITVLRPVKSEASLADSVYVGEAQLFKKHISASNLPGQYETKPIKKAGSPKNRRITPNSPPPTQLVPRPNNFLLKRSSDSECSKEIKRDSPTSGDIPSKSSPKSARPMVALKPPIKTPPSPNQIPVKQSPRSPLKDMNKSNCQTDKDGYEIPKKDSQQLAKKKKGSNTSYEYEQIDDVMSSPSDDKRMKNRHRDKTPSEYASLDKRTLGLSNYQDLISPTKYPSSSGTSSRRSSQHEYETPLDNEAKKQTLDRDVYLEILD